ncbi:MAG: RraA family protein [Caldilineaceae bacterium]|nr:RraA family protein [Caldilineaceae bacterium]HRJ42568.1 RraA family protein [Caldilineaceae bacterium]
MTTLPFDNDLKLFALMKEQLYAAVLCDALDQVGYRQQAMRADIRPIYPEAVVVGRALTMESVDVYAPEENVYEHEIAAVDSLKPGDVMVASTQRSTRTCVWGELLSTAAMARGANGAVIDGYTRDVRLIQKMGFPLFSTGIYPVDSAGRGEVIHYNRIIECGGVVVSPGDLIFGDYDGVVVIPKEALRAVVERAVAKVEGESITRAELRKGATLRQVFDKYGVL